MPKKNDYQKQMQKHRRKQQLQKAKKKQGATHRYNKPRGRGWQGGDDWDDYESGGVQRIRPRGSTEQRRALEKAVFSKLPEEETAQDVVANHSWPIGMVVEAVGDSCRVLLPDRELVCSLRGTLKQRLTVYNNLLAVGDRVLLSLDGEHRGVVEQVLPRTGVLARPYSPDLGKSSSMQQLIAANVDALLVVASWRQPNFWPVLVDRYLVTAERNHIRPLLCINKIDLAGDRDEMEAVAQVYRSVGFQVLLTSALTGDGVDQLRHALSGCTTVLAGLSGAGKSSLLSAVQQGLDLRTIAVGHSGSNKDQGRHTTTTARLYSLNEGGAVIDTPGIREFGLAGLHPVELAEHYPEMAGLRLECRFSDCLHRDEPDCAVRWAVDSDRISSLRYDNYLKIINDLTV